MSSSEITGLRAAESQTAAQSTVLRRELSLADLALAQILIVIVPEFFGTAVKAGPSHVVLWLLAILLFFVPQALVVAHLNRLMPLEGGLYEWARLAFGDRVGFLVAWNMWLNTTVQVSQIALVTTTYIAYAIGSSGEWIASSPLLLVGGSIALIAGMMVIARLGLSVGKWVSNAGSIFTVLILGSADRSAIFSLASRKPAALQPAPAGTTASHVFQPQRLQQDDFRSADRIRTHRDFRRRVAQSAGGTWPAPFSSRRRSSLFCIFLGPVRFSHSFLQMRST